MRNTINVESLDFDCECYRSLYPDLEDMNCDQLIAHYLEFGIKEGRRASRIASRSDFVKLIKPDSMALEIGPFASPILNPESNVFYCDVLSREQLRARAANLNINPGLVPEIHYLVKPNDLSTIKSSFDAIVSSHVIEHQPDIVSHLIQVCDLLNEGGYYYCIIPDKRYCFDKFNPISTMADVLTAYCENRKEHTLKSLIEHRCMLTHNDAGIHWNDQTEFNKPMFNTLNYHDALVEFNEQTYIDVHAWYFTPESFSDIIETLNRMGIIKMQLKKIYPTQYGSNEFFALMGV